MATQDKESRLQRWARLKQEEKQASGPAISDLQEDVPETGREVDSSEEVVEIRAEDLPDIESLDEHSDYTVFMQKGVPEELSRRALRKLWSSNPVFAFRDGLNEYDDDYSVIQAIDAAVDTAYKVGRGFMSEEDVGEDPSDAAKASGEAVESDSQQAEAGTDNTIKSAHLDDGNDENALPSHSGGNEGVLASTSVRKPAEGEV